MSQDIFDKKIMNISVADIFGDIWGGHGYDFGTIVPQKKQQDLQLRLNFNTGKYRAKNKSIFYGFEMPIRVNHLENSGTEFLIGLYPYVSFVKLMPISETIFLTSEYGFRIGYEYYQTRMNLQADININTWLVGTFIKPLSAIFYVKKNLGITLSPWSGQLSFQTRSITSPGTPGRKGITSLLNLSGTLIPSIGIQLKLK
ncbi:hypothetical protein AH06_01820 [candidate division TM6 bacterium Zodletone_IIa]|nr:hypothetical protein AH06_01820 [candidate division TM6 bacterium Zodletone_IIa]